MKTSKPGGILLASALIALVLGAFVAGGYGQQPGRRSQLMRQKLDHSQKVLEGLVLEDFTSIARQAHALHELSEAAEWQAFPSMEYERFSGEFRRLAGELAQQADAKNIDGATLSYVQLTINCVNCHKYVRVLRRDDSDPQRLKHSR